MVPGYEDTQKVRRDNRLQAGMIFSLQLIRTKTMKKKGKKTALAGGRKAARLRFAPAGAGTAGEVALIGWVAKARIAAVSQRRFVAGWDIYHGLATRARGRQAAIGYHVPDTRAGHIEFCGILYD